MSLSRYCINRTKPIVLCRLLPYNEDMKFDEKLLAIKLRKQGLSYASIKKEVNVSRSTLSLWLRDIKLSDVQQKKLYQGQAAGRYKGAKSQQQRRIKREVSIILGGKIEFEHLLVNSLFLIGLALYWAEGDKRQIRVKFTNSDETMIQIMMKWFREVCNVPESKFRIALHIHNLHSRKDAQRYWSRLTGVPLTQFHKVVIKETTLFQRGNVLYNGTCGIYIHDRALFRKIVGWRLGLLEYFGVSPRSSTDRTRDF